VGVISTGLTLLIERVMHELDLEYAIANRLVAKTGVLTGQVKVNVEHGRKGEAVDLFLRAVRRRLPRSDHGRRQRRRYLDVRALRLLDRFQPVSEKTARAATVVVRGESLLSIVNLLPLDATLPQ